MNIKHYLKHQHSPLIKFIIYGATALFAIVAIVVFTNTYLTSSRASQERVDISFGPDKLSMEVGESKSVVLKLFASEGKKIVAFDVKVSAYDSVIIKSIGQPKAVGKDVNFIELNHTRNDISAIADIPAGGIYPSALYIPIEITATRPGPGKLLFITRGSQIVGEIAGYEYVLNPKNNVIVNVLKMVK